jgi:hypothetical protein
MHAYHLNGVVHRRGRHAGLYSFVNCEHAEYQLFTSFRSISQGSIESLAAHRKDRYFTRQ